MPLALVSLGVGMVVFPRVVLLVWFLSLLFMFPGAVILNHCLMLSLSSMPIISNVVLFVPGLDLSLLLSLLGMFGLLDRMFLLANVFFLVLPELFVGP